MVKFIKIPCLSSHTEQRNVGDTTAMPCKHPAEVNPKQVFVEQKLV